MLEDLSVKIFADGADLDGILGLADDADEMRRQARLLASWGDNVYVKIPVTTTTGEAMAPLVRELSEGGVKVNVTAVFTTAQVELVTAAVKDGAPSYVSVFAGRIADAGIDPQPIMARGVDILLDAVQMFRRDALAARFSL